ncbi:hypothetical protein [Roseiconus lacunae]|uniref:hypothetical protein n=1 Tax=Roseiconus lacunae TaxID=2605694 RepID=UPI0013DA30F0
MNIGFETLSELIVLNVIASGKRQQSLEPLPCDSSQRLANLNVPVFGYLLNFLPM